MKNILFIILIIITTLSCKAQSPIISLEDDFNNDDLEIADNSYIKDINNKWNPFYGEWKWEEGTSSFTIVFYKIEMVYDGEIYEDRLVGKYQYIEDGVEIVNTLSFNNIDATNFGKNYGVMIRSVGYRADNLVSLGIYDIVKKNPLSADAKILTQLLFSPNGNVALAGSQLRWRLRFGEGPFIEEQFSPYGYFSLPANVVLIKQ